MDDVKDVAGLGLAYLIYGVAIVFERTPFLRRFWQLRGDSK